MGPIDNDTIGGDNRPQGQSDPGVGYYTVPTDENGEARVTLTMSMQPGNNYRAAASVIQEAVIFQTDQEMADALSVRTHPTTGKLVANGSFYGYQVPAVWSKMLTVWRKLHVEFDTMQSEPTILADREPDWQEVRVVDVTVQSDYTEFHLENSLSGNSPHQYEGGKVVIGGIVVFNVVNHTENVLDIAGVLPQAIIDVVLQENVGILKDDDPENGLLPHLFTLSALVKNAYADAYIEIVELDPAFNPQTTIDFDLYVTSTEMNLGLGWNDSKDQDSEASFWTSFMVAGYQAGGLVLGAGERDLDPDPMIDNSDPSGPLWQGDEYNETGQYGWTATFGDWDSIIFRATIVDLPSWPHFESQTIAHEIGHSGGNTGSPEQHHNEGGLMSGSLHELHDSFRAPTLLRFREAAKW